jgi:nucleotide-binding universal stress UspA family protein
VFHSEDSRSGLADLIAAGGFDLVILSARGRGANSGMNVPYGSTVAYLAGRCPVPMLIVRPDSAAAEATSRGAPRTRTRFRIRPSG